VLDIDVVFDDMGDRLSEKLCVCSSDGVAGDLLMLLVLVPMLEERLRVRDVLLLSDSLCSRLVETVGVALPLFEFVAAVEDFSGDADLDSVTS
jgi:hypothetical protein